MKYLLVHIAFATLWVAARCQEAILDAQTAADDDNAVEGRFGIAPLPTNDVALEQLTSQSEDDAAKEEQPRSVSDEALEEMTAESSSSAQKPAEEVQHHVSSAANDIVRTPTSQIRRKLQLRQRMQMPALHQGQPAFRRHLNRPMQQMPVQMPQREVQLVQQPEYPVRDPTIAERIKAFADGVNRDQFELPRPVSFHRQEDAVTAEATAYAKTEVGGFLRPKALTTEPDVVAVGLYAKNFYGASLKSNKFTLDCIIGLSWNDTRAIALVPAGSDRLVLSTKQAMKKLWMPEVVITNRDIRKLEVISSTVIIMRTGEVRKVERALSVINNIFELEHYPFDSQKLQVKVASSKYMLNDLVLTPTKDDDISGARKDLFEAFPYTMTGWKVYAFKETDGALQKSRGVLEIKVDRKIDKYMESHLTPAVLLLLISWGVFWFPFQQPFITPRLALSILALLSFTTLMVKSGNEIPDGAPRNWNDVLNGMIQGLMFCTILINIMSEIFKWHFKMDDIAQAVNHEAKIVQPVLSLVVLTIILTGGKYKWISISLAGIICKTLIAVTMVTYMGHRHSDMKVQKREKEQKEKEKQAVESARSEVLAATAGGAAGGAAATP